MASLDFSARVAMNVGMYLFSGCRCRRAIDILVHADDGEPGGNLTADLRFQRVAELQRLVRGSSGHPSTAANASLRDGRSARRRPDRKYTWRGWQSPRAGSRRGAARETLRATRAGRLARRQFDTGCTTRSKRRPQTSRRFAMSPRTVVMARPCRSAMTRIALQLLRRVIENRDGRARRREDRRLLSAARREAQNVVLRDSSHARGTGLIGVRTISQRPCRASSISCGDTGTVH